MPSDDSTDIFLFLVTLPFSFCPSASFLESGVSPQSKMISPSSKQKLPRCGFESWPLCFIFFTGLGVICVLAVCMIPQIPVDVASDRTLNTFLLTSC